MSLKQDTSSVLKCCISILKSSAYIDLPYVPVWPGQSRNLRSCPGQLSESPGFSWSQVVMLVS